MKIVWSGQSVQWFQNASVYTGYNKNLAGLLLERIPCRKTLCDIGCGAGLIDFELAPYFEQITCVDISREATSSIDERSARLGIENIQTLCMDAGELEGQWDTVIALFHGGADKITKYLHLAKDRLILATHGRKKGNFGPEGRKVTKCSDVEGYKAWFDEKGIKYSMQEVELEFGQPLADIDDAREFVRAYSMPMSDEELEAYLEQSLEKIDDTRFRFYLPNKKRFGIFVIRRDENEDI